MLPAVPSPSMAARSTARSSANVESALADLETAMKGDDKGQIRSQDSRAWRKPGQALYAAAAAASQPVAIEGAGQQQNPGEDVVDAEFTEVKEDEKK